MRRREIINRTGIAQTTFTSYFREGIIIILSENEMGRDYDPDSVERVKIAKQLTRLGFKLVNVRTLLDRVGHEQVLARITSQSVGEFETWANDQIQAH